MMQVMAISEESEDQRGKYDSKMAKACAVFLLDAAHICVKGKDDFFFALEQETEFAIPVTYELRSKIGSRHGFYAHLVVGILRRGRTRISFRDMLYCVRHRQKS
jgi:hypothetical protein